MGSILLRLWALAEAALVSFIVCGCGSSGPSTSSSFDARPRIGAAVLAPQTDPAHLDERGASGREVYPLRIGNHWHYATTWRLQFLPEVWDTVIVYHGVTTRDLVCSQSIAGQDYIVERQVSSQPPGVRWLRYRQDPSGLYLANVMLGQPPPCALPAMPSGRSPSVPASPRLPSSVWEDFEARTEVLRSPPTGISRSEGRTAGPLHAGAKWMVNSGMQARVEGVEVLRLPAGRFVAYRVGLRSENMRPGEESVVWYGRSGYLGSHARWLHYPEVGPPDYWLDATEVLDSLDVR